MLVARQLPTLFGLAVLAALAAAPSTVAPRRSTTLETARSIVFVENQGQFPADVLWQASGAGFTASFGRDYFIFQPSTGSQRISLLKTNRRAILEPLDLQPGKFNFFRGNDPKHWRSGLATYARLRYTNIYPGIDLLFYGHDGKLEYDFVVAPGKDPAIIRLRVDDAQSQITPQGELRTGDGTESVLHRPLLYQNTDRGKRVVEGRFTKFAGGNIGFAFTRYDAAKTLIIDPSLSLLYSTYLGGPHDDEATGIVLDAQNNAYIAGFSASEDYPVSANAYQTVRKNLGQVVTNVVVTKMNSSGVLLYSTFLGGSTEDISGGIVLDSQGNAYLTGATKSSDFPVTPNAYQKTLPAASGSAFLAELSSDGSQLLYSSFFGGAGGAGPLGDAAGFAVARNPQGNVMISGNAGPGLPTTPNGYLKQISSGTAAFVAIFNLALSGPAQLVASTYYGASTPAANNSGTGNLNLAMALDSSGNPWIAGQTFTNNLPTTANAYQGSIPAINPNCGGVGLNSAAYFAKLSADLTTLDYATYLTGKSSGAACSEYAHAIVLDGSGNVYVAGTTASSAFPTTTGAFQATSPSGAGYAEFVSKLSPDGTQLLWSTYLGGSGTYSFQDALALDSQNDVWVSGTTQGGASFPLQNAYQAAEGGGYDGHVTQIKNDGSAVLYSTYLGGSGDDVAAVLAVDSLDNVYVGGYTTSRNFPVSANAFQPVFANGDPVYDGNDVFFTVLGTGAIGGISPLMGGNAGDTTITVTGAGFQTGATCSLTPASGNGAIQASAVTISASGTSITCTFPLSGAATGSYSVAVTNADGTAFTSQQAFQVIQGGSPNVWANVAGRSSFRVGVPATYYIDVGNSGSSDAYFTVVWVGLDPMLTYNIPGGIVSTGDTSQIDYQQAEGATNGSTGLNYLGFIVPLLKTGDSLSIPIQVTAQNEATLVTIAVASNLPWFSSRAPALAELAAYQALNTFGIPQVCLPVDATGSIQDCAGYWINYVAGSASRTQDSDSPIEGNPDPSGNPAPLASYVANFVTGLTNTLGVPTAAGSSIALPVAQTSGAPAIGLRSSTVYLSSLADSLAAGGSAAPTAESRAAQRSQLRPAVCQLYVVQPQAAWEKYQQSECFGFFVIEWRLPVYGTDPDAFGTQCISYIYKSTTQPCFPLLPRPCPTPPFSSARSRSQAPRPVLRPSIGAGDPGGGGASCPAPKKAEDPNDKSGPTGDGSPAQYIPGGRPITYNVGFENEASASLPAAQVVVTDQLDPTKVDLSTLSLGSISFGANLIGLPSGTSNYNTTYPINSSLSVRIQGSLNPGTGLLTWTFTSIDPTTGLPPSDPTVGFLPPDVDGVEGQGGVVFSVMPKSTLTTGTQITNMATVVFDANAPINTQTWLNTVDKDPPSSGVTALPAVENQATFNVAWTGTDKGSGIVSYNIYVSDNGGPFTVWQPAVSTSVSPFTGQPGHTYGFYSIATDGAGNVQAAKNVADSTTTVSASATGSGPLISAVVNGASFQPGSLAGGTIFSIFGSNLASGVSGAASLPFPTQLGGVSITLQGLAVPLIYVSAAQINAQIPFGIPDGPASMVLTSGAAIASPVNVPISGLSPGLFLAGQHAAAQNQDFSANTSSNPAAPGSVLQVYFTGQGALDRYVATGAASPGSPPANVVAATTATIGGQNATVMFSGMTPGVAGLAQANIVVPNLAPGDYPLQLTVGGIAANPGTVSVGPAP